MAQVDLMPGTVIPDGTPPLDGDEEAFKQQNPMMV
jgi:hypothetical protein